MFNKSLFKQSCKANGLMWSVITFAVCFMLACVMLISGNSTLSSSKNAFQNTIIEGELTSQLQSRGLNYYLTSNKALEKFDTVYITTGEALKNDMIYNSQKDTFINKLVKNTHDMKVAELMKANETIENKLTPEQIEQQATQAGEFIKVQLKALDTNSPESLKILMSYYGALDSMDSYVKSLGFESDSQEELEMKGLVYMVLNPLSDPIEILAFKDEDGNGQFNDFYKGNGEKAPTYNHKDLYMIINETDEATKAAMMNDRKNYRDIYAAKNSAIFMAGNLMLDENVNMILNELTKYGVNLKEYEEFGFKDYNKVKEIATGALINFRANYEHRIENYQGEVTEEVKVNIANELSKEVSKSLLSSLPKEISEALEELGQADLYGTLVGSIFFKMAGLLLPIIYMIMTSNSLIAGQVDSGSMAYILSTSTKRRTVTFTQATYLIGSLFAMFTCTAITSVICFSCIDVETSLTYGKLLIINLGAFIVMFAMSGICFLASCFFNRSKHSMAIGGGLNMFFLVATMLGLFGSQVLPKLIRMEALNAFNYVSIISLFDVISILEGGFNYIWKFAILIGIGTLCYVLGSEKFARKDLPL